MDNQLLKLTVWNANGLSQHARETEAFLKLHSIDIMLISETHFTQMSHLKFHNYEIYSTNHPSGNARGGSAIIIKKSIQHNSPIPFKTEHIQATTVEVLFKNGNISVTALYCPPRHNNKREDYKKFFLTLGKKFIAGGDFNAKHTQWGSRLITTKGRALLATINEMNLDFISTGEPTYWPTDITKTPDLIDFCVSKGLDKKLISIKSSLELSSDHTPIMLTIHNEILKIPKKPSLTSRKTDWEQFKENLDQRIKLDIPLKSNEDVELAVMELTAAIQSSAWLATPSSQDTHISYNNPPHIKTLLKNKRRVRKIWQQTRSREVKNHLNYLSRLIKTELQALKNESVQKYLSNLTATEATDYNLWKATKKLKQPQHTKLPIKKANGQWTRTDQEKSEAFSDHLKGVFTPWESTTDNEVNQFLEAPFQLDLPLKTFRVEEVWNTIRDTINPKKSPGFDLITGNVLHNLTPKALRVITLIYNSVLRLRYFPVQWKISEIIMIQKPGKPAEETTSYRPISLLPIFSKLLEKLLIQRMTPIIAATGLIPDYQFGFRNQHSTVEQIHRIVCQINKDMNKKLYSNAVFLDVSQAFDKVWHDGLLYKIKQNLPYQFYEIIKSYLENRTFYVKQNDAHSKLYEIKSGVPQGSVLGPLLYLIYTSDLPTSSNLTIATFADDTAIIASHDNPFTASFLLQRQLTKIQSWFNKWKIKVNESKSVQVTFALRDDSCPPLQINNVQIPQSDTVKYLGLHLDRRLTWQQHIFNKRKQLGLKLTQMNWLMGRRSQLSIENKLLLYKAILKPIWTYGIQIWGTASHSNIEILQRFQNKVLRKIVDAPWYVPNKLIQNDLKIPSIQEEIVLFCTKYKKRLEAHPNQLAQHLMEHNQARRLKKRLPSDLI